MGKNNKRKNPKKPQRQTSSSTAGKSADAARSKGFPKKSIISVIASLASIVTTGLLGMIIRPIGRRRMNYTQIVTKLEEMLREHRGQSQNNVLAHAIKNLHNDLRMNRSDYPDYFDNFDKLYVEKMRIAGVTTLPEEQYALFHNLVEELLKITELWNAKSGDLGCSNYVAGVKVSNESTSAFTPAADCKNEVQISRDAEVRLTQTRQLNGDLQVQCSKLQTDLRERDRQLAALETEANSLRDRLQETKDETRQLKQSNEKINSKLNAAESKISNLENSSVPKDIEGLQQRLVENPTIFPEDLKQLLSGILTLKDALNNGIDSEWFRKKQNLDKLMVFIYGTVDSLPLLAKRGLKEECFLYYYCLLRAQYNIHILLESYGLKVICPSKGEIFQKEKHDFSEKDLVWVGDKSRDNQIDYVKRVGFEFKDTTGKVSVLSKAQVRRCIYSSESLLADSSETNTAVDNDKQGVAELTPSDECISDQTNLPTAIRPGEENVENEHLTIGKIESKVDSVVAPPSSENTEDVDPQSNTNVEIDHDTDNIAEPTPCNELALNTDNECISNQTTPLVVVQPSEDSVENNQSVNMESESADGGADIPHDSENTGNIDGQSNNDDIGSLNTNQNMDDFIKNEVIVNNTEGTKT